MRTNSSDENHDIVVVELDPNEFTLQRTTVFDGLDQMRKHYEEQLDLEATDRILEQFHRVSDYIAVELPSNEVGRPMLLLLRGKRGSEFDEAVRKEIQIRKIRPELRPADLAEALNQRIHVLVEQFCARNDLPDPLLIKVAVYDVLSDLRSGSLQDYVPGCHLVPYVDTDMVTMSNRASLRPYPQTSHLKHIQHDLLNSLTSFLQDDLIEEQNERDYRKEL